MIQIQSLVKDYGSLRAVDHINLEITEGEILGFLGPNGAGKSTTLKLLTGYLSPTAGTIKVNGMDITEESQKIRSMIGYLPENNPLYTEMTVYDFLTFIAEAREIETVRIPERIASVAEVCGLTSVISRPIRQLSKGYRQRTGLAQAIIHDPKFLILDEPTSGLDPNQILEIRELIRDLGKDKTLIISTHILQEVQAVADRIVIINKGKIVADGPKDALLAENRGKALLDLELKAPAGEVKLLSQDVADVRIITLEETAPDHCLVELEYPAEKDIREDIYRYIHEKPWIMLGMSRRQTSLENVFRDLTIEQPGHQKQGSNQTATSAESGEVSG